MTGAELLIRLLKEQAVDTIFGYPGGAVLPVYDALFDDPELRHILVRHEQAAVHAADGYARVTGRPGVALVTSGPGATNAVTGIATAYMDSVPLIVLTGQVSTDMIGLDSFQEVDIYGMTMPVTKHNYIVLRVEDLPRIVREAFYLAATGRPGPVLIDLPKNVMMSVCPDAMDIASAEGSASVAMAEGAPSVAGIADSATAESSAGVAGIADAATAEGSASVAMAQRPAGEGPRSVQIRGYEAAPPISEAAVAAMADRLRSAERPLLLVGGGCLAGRAPGLLMELAERGNFPIACTLMGIGVFPSRHPLHLGMVGMHGTVAANRALQAADVLVCLGVRFSDRVTGNRRSFSPDSFKIQIDIDEAELGKNIHVDLAISAAMEDALDGVLSLLQPIISKDASCAAWHAQLASWAEAAMRKQRKEQAQADLLTPQEVIRCLDEATGGNAVVTTDVGQHQIWTAHHYSFSQPRSLLTSGGLGTMGYGFPAAIGAAVACPDRPILCVSGDGSFQMNMQEIMTAVDIGANVKVAILKNGYLGMVRQWQQLFLGRRYSAVRISSPDFAAMAGTFGAAGYAAGTIEEARTIIREALQTDGPAIMVFDVVEEANVYPIVPPGASNQDMIVQEAAASHSV